MYLHDAIKQILLENGNSGLTAHEIAELNEQKKLYRRKKDGEFPEAWQINLRVRNYSAVKLKNPMFKKETRSGKELIYIIDE